MLYLIHEIDHEPVDEDIEGLDQARIIAQGFANQRGVTMWVQSYEFETPSTEKVEPHFDYEAAKFGHHVCLVKPFPEFCEPEA